MEGLFLVVIDSIPWFLNWVRYLSFFNAAFEALLVNEMRHLQLKEIKYGLEIDVIISINKIMIF